MNKKHFIGSFITAVLLSCVLFSGCTMTQTNCMEMSIVSYDDAASAFNIMQQSDSYENYKKSYEYLRSKTIADIYKFPELSNADVYDQLVSMGIQESSADSNLNRLDSYGNTIIFGSLTGTSDILWIYIYKE